MFYFLSKFLPMFVYPLGLACILLVVALCLGRRSRWQSQVLIVILLMLWLAGNKWVTMALVSSLEWQHAAATSAVPQAEVIVVLGGGTRPQAYPRSTAELNRAGNRLLHAAWLYQQGLAPRIVLSGGNATWVGPDSQAEAESMADILVLMGVPREAMLLESTSRNTHENALETQALLEKEGIQHIILVTSATHMPRANRVFMKTGLQVSPAPTDFIFTQTDWDYFTQLDPLMLLVNFPPTAENFVLTSQVMKEYIGILIYNLRGWL